jgi:hypothetical protein
MTTNSYCETAKIYRFPTKFSAPGGQKTETTVARPTIMESSGWYHEAALQETDPARKPS